MIARRATSVLVVEDDMSLVRLLSVLLQTEGYEVRTSMNGAKGLVSLVSDPPDVVILDLSMPGIDGRTFYRQARANGYRGPVMICSAFGAQAARDELGAEASISKPFDPFMLLNELKALVSSR